MNKAELEALAGQAAGIEPPAIMAMALQHFPKATISFSGAEDVVLIHMAQATGLPFHVFTLDTGRLFPQTYRFIDQVRDHFGVAVEVLFPDYRTLEPMVNDKGLTSFYRDGHHECCQLRKVEPLRRKLSSLGAWITGQRHDQNPATRAHLPAFQADPQFFSERLVKINPLAAWNKAQVWRYILEHQIPWNPLHAQGYVSIGCEPCTRSINPGQHEREGRWWWEDATKRECGLHLDPDAVAQGPSTPAVTA